MGRIILPDWLVKHRAAEELKKLLENPVQKPVESGAPQKLTASGGQHAKNEFNRKIKIKNRTRARNKRARIARRRNRVG